MSNTSVQITLQNEHIRNVRAKDAAARIVGEKVYQAECVSVGSTNSVREEERW